MTPTHRTRGAVPVLRSLTPDDVLRLQDLRGPHLVSVLAATSPGPRMSPQDHKQLRELCDRAEARLEMTCSADEVALVVDQLALLTALVAEESTSAGVALFVGAGVAEAYRLSLAPATREVVDPTFATRDLHRVLLDSPPHRVLVLAAGTARLHLSDAGRLRPHPIDLQPAGEEEGDPDRRGHLHQPQRSHQATARWDAFLRDVEGALDGDERTRHLPLVLAAAEPLASRFRSRRPKEVIGVVAGNHQRTSYARLAELSRPIIEDHVAGQRAMALEQLDEARNRGRAVAGIEEVWRAAQRGRVVSLVVDPRFHYPAFVGRDDLDLLPASDPTHPTAIDDAVDEVIEAVRRTGAPATFAGLPASYDQIAAVVADR